MFGYQRTKGIGHCSSWSCQLNKTYRRPKILSKIQCSESIKITLKLTKSYKGAFKGTLQR